jgi:arsenate reductase-like glutaredoxin family protein
MSCRTYRLERQSIIRITKQHKNEPRPLKFAHLFKNATTVDEILKFLEKTEIATRNWLQNQGRTKEKGVDEGVEEREE